LNAVNNSEPHGLIRKTFHSNAPLSNYGSSFSFWQNRLSQAYCYGSGKTKLNANITDKYWKVGEVLSLSGLDKEESTLNPTERVGLGYMLMHNLWRLDNPSITDVYRNELCPCYSTALVTEYDYVKTYEMDEKPKKSVITSIEITPRKFSDYADINIPKPFYISHNVDVNTNGKVQVAGDLTVCGSEMTVNSGGEVYIPNTDPAYPTTMEVDNGGILKLKSGSVLRVENNSTLRIASAGKLTIYPNTQIILDGPHANLIIEGTLDLQANATFSIQGGASGLGFVTFRKDINPDNGNETFANIVAGTNASINITGADKNQKVLVVDGNFGLVVPEELATFNVTNGKIHMGKMSRIYAACPVQWTDVVVRPVFDDGRVFYFAGLMTVGQKDVVLKNCTFINGMHGVMSANYLYPHSKPSIEHCTFQDVDEAIRVDGGGIDMKHTTVLRSLYGFQGYGMNVASNFLNVKLEENKANFFAGNSSSSLNWVRGGIKESEDGLVFIGGTMYPRCLQITDNWRYGVYAQGYSNINLSTTAGAGYNTLSNNQVGIYNRSYEGDLYGIGRGIGVGLNLISGYNSFANNTTKALDIVATLGSINQHLAGPLVHLESSKNYWGSPLPPQRPADYDIILKPNWGVPLVNPEINTLGRQLTSAGAHVQALSEVGCASVGLGINGTGGGEVAIGDKDYSAAMIITCGDEFNKPVHVVYHEGNQLMFGDQLYDQAMDKYEAILDCPIALASQNGDLDYLLYNTYRNYLTAFGKKMATDSTEYSLKTPLVDRVITQIDQLLTQASTADSKWSGHKAMLTLDKADCYRIKDDRPTALSIYDNMLLESTTPELVDIINYYKCIAEGEQLVIQNEITVFDKLATYNCELPTTLFQSVMEGDSLIPSGAAIEPNMPLLGISIHPNPTNGSFTLSFNEELRNLHVGQAAYLEVADGYGIPHVSVDNVDINIATTIDLSGYKAGVYHIRCAINNRIYTKYLVLTDQ
jgi:hypothetical protein